MTGIYLRLAGLALLVAAVVAGWLYVSGLRQDVARLESERALLLGQRDQAIATAQANADVAARLEREHARQMDIVTEVIRAEQQARTEIDELKGNLNAAPEPTGPCAAVDPGTLGAAITGLRQRRAARHADQGGGSAADRPGGAADVPR